ncbi:Uma2 family endonuclease [Streptomyces chitinivorans]|uniref:Uma2 family endonuclease n=1 Tax=Streptomyces chitinivorans TaxID=1257027 RepID=A0ABW7HY36_9ACTN|nr:Uma2 family endonuclease [Streptomyces chitinivorans]MDH2407441.1 Uma2 family endonuclease [Streptomyces chitinivorans]
MAADPITEPMNEPQDPIDLLIAFEKAADAPIRAEYVEGTMIVAPQPDDHHNDAATEFYFQLRSAGFRLAGIGSGYRLALQGETRSLLIPDFYVRRRKPTELDEAYRRAHRGWYSIELLALAGEITSTNHETDTGPKYRGYAAAGVPVYVLVHRQEKKAYAFSDPVREEDPAKAHYATRVEVDLGRLLPLPAPYPALDTAPLLEGQD